MYKFVGKKGRMYELKFNYKCPKGTVDDSNKCKPDNGPEPKYDLEQEVFVKGRTQVGKIVEGGVPSDLETHGEYVYNIQWPKGRNSRHKGSEIKRVIEDAGNKKEGRTVSFDDGTRKYFPSRIEKLRKKYLPEYEED